MDVGASVIAHPQATEAAQPSEVALHDPAVATEALLAFDAPPSNPRRNPAAPTRLPTVTGIIALVCMELVGPPAGAPERSLDRRHGIQHRGQRQRVRAVRRTQPRRQRDALSVVQYMLLRARAPAIRGVGPGDLAPPFAGTRRLSRLARDHAMRSALPNRSSKVRCNRSHTPACCQSRSRRQQVTPLPQPISWGSNSHGIPLRSTNRMPVSVARSGTRGRPPLGFGGSAGSNGSITSHSSSLTSGLLMPLLVQDPDHRARF